MSRKRSSDEGQTVPSWAGWLSLTSSVLKQNQSVVDYMSPINFSINENTTVCHVLDISQEASENVGQEFTIVTFDLAVAKKAYSLVWQNQERYKNVIVRMGVFHTTCSLLGVLGKRMTGSGFADLIIEADVCASGSLTKVMSGKHYNRAIRVHRLMLEALERLLYETFESQENISQEIGEGPNTTPV